jgi:uncharacterized membrane protein required for colicin V production
MTIYDAAMVGAVVLGMVWGAWRGITWQVASIASLVLGYLVAHPLSAQLAPRFPGEPVVARALAMLASYAVVSGGVFLAAWIVRATLRRLKFEAFDRHLGMVLGGLEGGLLGLVVTVFVVGLAPQAREPIFQSPSGRVVARVLDAVGPVLPTEIRNAVLPYWPGHGGPNREDLPLGPGPELTGRDEPEPEPLRIGPPRGEAREGRDESVGRTLGKAVERGIDRGDASVLDDLYKEGRTRLGRAAGEALERQLERLGDRDGGDRDPRRR